MKYNNDGYIKDTDCYFAASNSGDGFISYFDKIFDNSLFDHIYILKGGPGTGKSSLMKQAAAYAKKQGQKTEKILCSSDPESLDGVIIYSNNKRTAILDGTAPHTRDCSLPGVVDEIVDLGQFWNGKTLKEHRTEIEILNDKKKNAYESAYAFLKAAKAYQKRKERLLLGCLDRDKMIKKICRTIPLKQASGSFSKISYKLRHAISVNGLCTSEIYRKDKQSSIGVIGDHDTSFAFLGEIFRYCTEKHQNVTISPSPLCPDRIDAISIDETEISFFDANGEGSSEIQQINSERFFYESKLREIKAELRLLSKLYGSAMTAAYKALEKAKEHHFALEEIYIRSMNFDQKELAELHLLQDIFG